MTCRKLRFFFILSKSYNIFYLINNAVITLEYGRPHKLLCFEYFYIYVYFQCIIKVGLKRINYARNDSCYSRLSFYKQKCTTGCWFWIIKTVIFNEYNLLAFYTKSLSVMRRFWIELTEIIHFGVWKKKLIHRTKDVCDA